ncbi:TetR/AcrR family transcriptional regulator [Alphaproteobacteria bacterium KMM 3653]|uniref:TetR/AcrR family transcriptional regulator n=1 Tax=Harenicola maris TaxID=2841044 RepID=A0AAP2CLT0_9RHOB|nr:TetR/AcrR family transcriptional regulator [Harenicola maris]
MARAAPYDREATLDAAMSLFWDKGYHATSLKDLEGALSMKPGSIYAAFKSKENLYLLAMERYFAASRSGFRSQIAQSPSPLAGLAAHLRAYASLPAGDEKRRACMLVKTFVDTRSTDAAIAGQSQSYLNEMRGEIAQVFEAAIEQGEIASDSDAQELARRFQAYVTAIRIELHQGTPADEVTNLADKLASEIESLQQ